MVFSLKLVILASAAVAFSTPEVIVRPTLLPSATLVIAKPVAMFPVVVIAASSSIVLCTGKHFFENYFMRCWFWNRILFEMHMPVR